MLPSDDEMRTISDLPSPDPNTLSSDPDSSHEQAEEDPAPTAPNEGTEHDEEEPHSPHLPSAPTATTEDMKPPEPVEPVNIVEPVEPIEPSAPPVPPEEDQSQIVDPNPPHRSGPELAPPSVEVPKTDGHDLSPSTSPHACDPSPVPSVNVNVVPAEPFFPPSPRDLIDVSSDVVLIGDVPEEFKGPHIPEAVGENGLLECQEEPSKLMKISMDTDDLNRALEKGATAVADQLAECLNELTLDPTNFEEKVSNDEDSVELARKISQQ